MKKTSPFSFSRLHFPPATVPLVLFIETVVAYGLLAYFQGFYFDDWQVLWLAETEADLWAFYAYDRPFSAWTYLLAFPLFGTNPLAWHGFNLLLRWIVSCLAWWVLRLVWPDQERETALMAILFAVYPAFSQQPIAVAYSQHLTTYALFLASLALMILSLRRERWKRWILMFLAILLQGAHVFTMEYFWGVELIRPVLISFLLARRSENNRRSLLVETAKVYLPYFGMSAAAVFWRLFIYTPPVEDPNALRWVAMLLSQPVQALIRLVEMLLQDELFVLVATWYQTLQVDLIDLDNRFLILTWLIVIASAVFLYFYVSRLRTRGGLPKRENWQLQMSIAGVCILLLGVLPVWLTNKQIAAGRFSDRFALASMLGAAVLLVVIITNLLKHRTWQLITVCVLAGLATGFHIRVGNEYRWAWIDQQRFYWQLKWRAPQLEPGTAIFSDGGIFTYTGDYPVSFAISLLYANQQSLSTTNPPYWFFELDAGFNYYPKYYLRGHEVHGKLRNIAFDGWSTESIIIDHNPDQGSCLWVVGEGDESVSTLPDLTRAALPMSDLSRIDRLPSEGEAQTPDLFGDEIAHTWCFYFQKAELARQFRDWEQILLLAEQVNQKQFEPQNRYEWRPFVDGYLHLGRYQDAQALTLRAYQAQSETADLFCNMWADWQAQLPDDNELAEINSQLQAELDCND
jgi:hypothetical protein